MNFRSQFCEKCIVRHTHICRELFGRCLGGLSFGSGSLENLCFAILLFCTKFLNAVFGNAGNLQWPRFQEFTCFAICLFQDFLWPNSSGFPRGSHIYTSGSPYLTGLLCPSWKQNSSPIKCPGTFQKCHFLTPPSSPQQAKLPSGWVHPAWPQLTSVSSRATTLQSKLWHFFPPLPMLNSWFSLRLRNRYPWDCAPQVPRQQPQVPNANTFVGAVLSPAFQHLGWRAALGLQWLRTGGQSGSQSSLWQSLSCLVKDRCVYVFNATQLNSFTNQKGEFLPWKQGPGLQHKFKLRSSW